MHTFQLDVFIDCSANKVYDHITQPKNLIGLQPLLTEMDILKETKDENGIVLRPFYTVETFRILSIPIYKNRIYSMVHLTQPKEELEFHVTSNPGIEIVFKYKIQSQADKRTHITQNVYFTRVPKLLENFVIDQARQAQRAVLSNLKARLEK